MIRRLVSLESMPTVPLIALKPIRYNERPIEKGESFVACSLNDAILLKSLGHAADAPPPRLSRAYQTRAVEADALEHDASASDVAEEPRKKRTYKRRDLTAEASE